jgi:transposase
MPTTTSPLTTPRSGFVQPSLWDQSHKDGTGLWILSKRLERGTFSWPKPSQTDSPKLKLTPEAFAMLTDGVDLRGAKMRPWYERE